MISAIPVLFMLTACSVLRGGEPAPDSQAIFPHAADYDQGAKHGPDALDLGVATCDNCHVAGATAPPCSQCHDVYPHQQGWIDGSVHGQGLYGKTGSTDACTDCHDQPGLTATDRYGCTSCHNSYPHQDGWKDAGVHGQYAMARGDAVAACGSCHGSDLDGGDVAVSCTQCHAVYPHTEGWEDGANHGVAAKKKDAECAACHADPADDTSWNGGNSGVPCSRCHAVYPHSADWKHDHMATAAQTGEPVCLTCHDAGDGPASMIATCGSTCHGGAR